MNDVVLRSADHIQKQANLKSFDTDDMHIPVGNMN